MPLSALSEPDDAVVEALAFAAECATPAAWEYAGTVAANHVIEHHRDLIESELTAAQAEWDTNLRTGANWRALIGAYRMTLFEYTAMRGN